jgi:hypothetical protein
MTKRESVQPKSARHFAETTPEYWSLAVNQGRPIGDAYFAFAEAYAAYGIFAEHGGVLATTYTDRPEDEANANLMAAAPAMLEALEDIADTLDKMAPCPEAILDRLLACAQSAIRLAKGESR